MCCVPVELINCKKRRKAAVLYFPQNLSTLFREETSWKPYCLFICVRSSLARNIFKVPLVVDITFDISYVIIQPPLRPSASDLGCHGRLAEVMEWSCLTLINLKSRQTLGHVKLKPWKGERGLWRKHLFLNFIRLFLRLQTRDWWWWNWKLKETGQLYPFYSCF